MARDGDERFPRAASRWPERQTGDYVNPMSAVMDPFRQGISRCPGFASRSDGARYSDTERSRSTRKAASFAIFGDEDLGLQMAAVGIRNCDCRAEKPRLAGLFLWAGLDSNQRPTDYESAALTN
jgi:hypothetical protein